MSMIPCDDIPAGMVVPAYCRPVRVGATPSSGLPDRLISALRNGLASAWNLAAYGVREGLGADVTAQRIQAGIDHSPVGSTVLFPPGVLEVDRPIRLRPSRAYAGSGRWGTIIRQADGANITGPSGVSGILVPQGWWDDAGFSGDPMSILNLRVDGNRDGNPTSDAAGIVLCNYFTVIDSCMVEHTPVDGVLLTDTTRDGTLIANSAAENRITDCRIHDTGRHGVNQTLGGQIAHLDGYLTDCTIDGTQADAVRMDRAAGWILRRLHVYEIEGNGIALDLCHGTVVTECQVEQFGRQASPGVSYAGISLRLLGVWGSHATNNFVSCEELSNGVESFAYYGLTAASGQNASVVLSGNVAQAPETPGTQGRGMVLQGDIDGSVLNARLGPNAIAGMATPTVVTGGVVTLIPDRYGVEHSDLGGDVANRFPGGDSDSGPVSGEGNDLHGTLTWGTGAAATAGELAGVAYTTGYSEPPIVQLTPLNDATTGLGISVTSNGWGFVVRAANPPALSQPAGTYQVAYTVS